MSGLRLRQIGPVKVWVGRSDYEHPSRWAGIYVPGLGEFEMFVTSDRRHPEPKPVENEIVVGQTITVPAGTGIDWGTIRYFGVGGQPT